jgi:chain length determinant protein EpsF
VTPQQFLLILLARRKAALYILLATVAATLAASLLTPNTYTASTSVVIDVKSPDPVSVMAFPAMALPGYMATQIDIIGSDRVAQRVVKLLKIDQLAKVQEDWKEATDGKVAVEVWLAERLLKSLEVKPSKESNVITIGYKGSDPVFAAALANAFAQAYIDTTIELRVEPARQYSAWFDQQSRTLRERLEAAKSRLSEYQQKAGIVATDDRLNFENQKLNELQSQLVMAETQAADSQSKQRSGGGDTLVDVMQNPVVLQLKGEIARLEGKLSEVSGNLGANHPQYLRMEAEIGSLRQQLDSETRKITTSITTAGKVGKGRQDELRSAIDSHKKHILELKGGRDEVGVLQQEVDSAQRSFDAINQRAAQTSLESASTHTNVAVLTPATAPLKASSPKILLNALAATFVGTILGVLAALVMELLDRRVRSTGDLTLALGLPILAELVPPRTPQRSLLARLGRALRPAPRNAVAENPA